MNGGFGGGLVPLQDRIDELIATLDSDPETPACAAARELVAFVLELHARGLARLLELVAAADTAAAGHPSPGTDLVASLAEDEEVANLLLLHGLHPQGVEARIRGAVERLHPHLGVQGIVAEELRVADDVVHLRLGGAPGALGHVHQVQALRRDIEEAILAAAPEVQEVRIEGLTPPGSVTYVPVASLTRHPRRAGRLGPGRHTVAL